MTNRFRNDCLLFSLAKKRGPTLHNIKQKAPQSIGFPRSVVQLPQTPRSNIALNSITTSPAQLSKSQPAQTSHKGRWFVSVIIGSIIAFSAVSLWNEFFRFQAYGELQGSVVRMSTPAAGVVNSFHANEGDLIQPGQLLVSIEVPELEFQRMQIERQLRLAMVDLQLRAVEMKVAQRDLQDRQIDRRVRYHELLGEFQRYQSELEQRSNTFETHKKLMAENAISRSEFTDSKTIYEGQKAQLDELASALRELNKSENEIADDLRLTSLFENEGNRIKALQTELDELNQSIVYAKEIRSPVGGRIVKRFAHAGEQLQANAPLLEFVESGSVEAVIYMPQNRSQQLVIGDRISVPVKPLGERLTFQVDRIAPRIVTPPDVLKTSYRAFKGLVVVYAKPVEDESHQPGSQTAFDLTTVVGAELALPRFGFRAGRTDSVSKDNSNSAGVAAISLKTGSHLAHLNEAQ